MIRRDRAGLTLVELLVVVLILGILARIGTEAYKQYTYRARAAAVVGEIQAVRLAAYAYNVDTNRWPPDVNRGIVPPELAPYLGAEFTFTRDRYVLDWDHWVLPDGSPSEPETGSLVGISLTTTDTILGRTFLDLLGDGAAKATITDHYTFILIAAD